MTTAILTVFAENENRDTFIDPATGDQAILTGAPAVGQLCKSRIESQRGEMIYAMSDGMPMFATVFDQFNPQQFEAAARLIILATQYVIAIVSFSMYRNGNVLNYSAEITTQYGNTSISGAAAQ